MMDIARLFTACALQGMADQPTNARADIYDFAAGLLQQAGHQAEADAAASAAHHLREAEASQLLLKNILAV
jgi:hypothetical protein